MSIVLIKIKMCKVRLIKITRRIDIKNADTNIVKNEVKKTKFRTKKSKNLKIIISKIFFKVKCYRCY